MKGYDRHHRQWLRQNGNRRSPRFNNQGLRAHREGRDQRRENRDTMWRKRLARQNRRANKKRTARPTRR